MSLSAESTLRESLRQGTESRHRALEALPFFRKLTEGSLGGRAWAGYLDALRIVYGTLADLLPSGAPPLPLDALADDLTAMAPAGAPEGASGPPKSGEYPGFAPVARVRAQLLAHRLRVWAHEDPVAFPGAAWVLEGAALGARVQCREAERAGLARAWLLALSDRGRAGWRRQLEDLEAGRPGAAGRERIVEAAQQVFDDFHSVVRALDPILTGLERDMVHELNPHAGTHSVPHSTAVLEAALRAGETSWRRWPYYRERFGERGRAFTRSDSAWLATLVTRSRHRALGQVVWLADLLASRGMPRLLMEEHLVHLHEELAGVPFPADETGLGSDSPGNGVDADDPWGGLLEAARLLGARRLAVVPADSAAEASRAFDARVPPELAARLPRTGLLLAAALADEADGIRGAVPSLTGWLTDRRRFPRSWAAQVTRTVREGRERLEARVLRKA